MNEKEIIKAIWDAVEDADIKRVRALIGSSKERLQNNGPFGTWLHIAATNGSLDLVKALIAMGADVNAKGGTYNGGAITMAAEYGHLPVVQTLLEAGAELDVSDSVSNPLFGAILGGHLDIVKLLIKSGIDFRVKYTGEMMKNMDALAFARERGEMEIAKYIESLLTDEERRAAAHNTGAHERKPAAKRRPRK